MAGFGAAMFFVLSLVASTIIGVIVATYVARVFLDVLNGSAAGDDQLQRSRDPLTDRLGDPIFLAYVMALPTVAGFGVAAAAFPGLVERPGGSVLVLFAVLWLFFPITLLSALSGTSRWFILHWEFLRRLPRRPLAVLTFYLSTGFVLALGGGAAYFALYFPSGFALGAVLVTAGCVLLHARLCGRLAWVIGQTPVGGGKPRRRRRVRGVVSSDPWEAPAADEHASPPSLPPTEETAIRDPLYVPPLTSAPTAALDEEEDEWTPNKKPYAFVTQAPYPPARTQEAEPPREPPCEAITTSPTRVYDDEDNEPRPQMMAASQEPAALPVQHELPQPDRIELRWMEGRKMPPMPRLPLVTGIWGFPFYAGSVEPLLMMSCLFLVWAAMIRFMLSLLPGIS